MALSQCIIGLANKSGIPIIITTYHGSNYSNDYLFYLGHGWRPFRKHCFKKASPWPTSSPNSVRSVRCWSYNSGSRRSSGLTRRSSTWCLLSRRCGRRSRLSPRSSRRCQGRRRATTWAKLKADHRPRNPHEASGAEGGTPQRRRSPPARMADPCSGRNPASLPPAPLIAIGMRVRAWCARSLLRWDFSWVSHHLPHPSAPRRSSRTGMRTTSGPS